METRDKLMLIISILFLVFVILIFVNAVKYNEIELQQPVVQPLEAQSVTFILGQDKVDNNPFYDNAKAYFSYNPYARTDHLTTDIHSLNEMILWINQTYEQSGIFFDTINLVVHSNPWAGMSLPIDRKGPRISAEILMDALKNHQIIPINKEAVTEETTLSIHACGLAKNTELVSALESVFKGSRLQVSGGYINFSKQNDLYERNEMQVYYAFYPTGYKPAHLHLERQLKERYPHEEKNWLDLIENSTYQYNIPVEWEIQYPEYEMPSLSDDTDKLEWLMNQDELLDLIEKTEIPFDHFRWIVKKKDRAIKVYGKATILCVLEQINV